MYIRFGYERVSILQLYGKYLFLNLCNIGFCLEVELQKLELFDRFIKGRQKEKYKGVNDKLQIKRYISIQVEGNICIIGKKKDVELFFFVYNRFFFKVIKRRF